MSVTLTEKAVSKIKEFYSQDQALAGKPLRVFVEKGGCSGYSYGFKFDDAKFDDSELPFEGFKVVIDPDTTKLISGSTIDYKEDFGAEGFSIQNPNAKNPAAAEIHSRLDTNYLTVTERAAAKAKQLLEKSGKPDAALRIRVISGGCSGMEYKIEPDTNPPSTKDTVIESQGIRVYMDSKGLLYMAGSELDYTSSLMGSGFKIKNPQAVAECSCGQSFTV